MIGGKNNKAALLQNNNNNNFNKNIITYCLKLFNAKKKVKKKHYVRVLENAK